MLKLGKRGMAGLEPWEGGVAGNKQWKKEIVDKSWKKISNKSKKNDISERSEEMPDLFEIFFQALPSTPFSIVYSRSPLPPMAQARPSLSSLA